MVTAKIERNSSGLEEPQEVGPELTWNPEWVLEQERDMRGIEDTNRVNCVRHGGYWWVLLVIGNE